MAASCADADALRCELAAAASNGTVVLTATDTSPEFEELVDNWACHLQRLSIPPLVWALDAATHRKLQSKARQRFGVRSVYSADLSLPERARPNEWKRPSSDEYTLAVALKPLVVLRVLRLGFDALFLDVDIALSADPRPWLFRSPDASLQVSLNYDDRPNQQKVTGVPDLNTGVLYARHSARGVVALVEQWAKRTAERFDCPRRPPLWACGDQEQLTRLLKMCGWKPLSFEAAARLDARNDAQELPCGRLWKCSTCPSNEALRVDVLPPRRFASGMSAGLWGRRWSNATNRWMGPHVLPADLYAFHPNFGGFAGGAKKATLQRLRFERGGGGGWCLRQKQ